MKSWSTLTFVILGLLSSESPSYANGSAAEVFDAFLGCAKMVRSLTPKSRTEYLRCTGEKFSEKTEKLMRKRLAFWAFMPPEMDRFRPCSAEEVDRVASVRPSDSYLCFDLLKADEVVTAFAFFDRENGSLKLSDVKY